ncbi:hypothetical protein [Bartonella sp. DGB2]|uniref:hypothetical protein n=1 Tax=Bartonella sp. DGB2 TaxID=3388426 RepID=UPI0039900DB5
MRQNPAYSIITLFGGVAKVASVVNSSITTVRKWYYPTDCREGKGGVIPAKYQIRLLNYAKDHNIDLRPDDFFYPERLQALLAQRDNGQEANSPPCGTSDLPQDAARAQSNPRMGAGGNHNNYSVHT